MNSLSDRINALLPQTQCTRCGYPDCASYAVAVASGDAGINQCPPGGEEGIKRLAAATGQAFMHLSPVHGWEGPRKVAVIDEAWCIGCTLCLPVCPTDAILGSNKQMHTVIEPHCTGCELCIPVCPVDCISLENVSGALTGWNAWSSAQAETARRRYAEHQARRSGQPDVGLAMPEDVPETATQAGERPPAGSAATGAAPDAKRALIEAALARARAQRQKRM